MIVPVDRWWWLNHMAAGEGRAHRSLRFRTRSHVDVYAREKLQMQEPPYNWADEEGD